MPRARTRIVEKKRAVKPPDSVLHPCPHCLIDHERFGLCADRVRRTIGGRKKVVDEVMKAAITADPRVAEELEREPAMTDAQVAEVMATRAPEAIDAASVEAMREELRGVIAPEVREEVLHQTVGDTGMTVAEIKSHELITDPAEIERLTPDALRRELKVRAAIDLAEKEHKKREEELGVKLARPEILRRTNDKAGKILLNQLDHVLASAGVTAHVAANPTKENLKKYIPVEEAQLTRDTLARIPETREKKRQEEDAKDALKTHVNGQTPWVCESDPESECYARVFYGASLEVVRKKAAAEPGWTFACPRCRGTRIRLADQREGVAA